jgi:uncharacterized RDD family membrane protein YckC
MQPLDYSIIEDRPVTYSGFWRRFLAMLIDIIILESALSILGHTILGNTIYKEDSSDILGLRLDIFRYNGTGTLLQTVIDWLYYALLEAGAWQATLGKRAMGIRVTDTSGGRISFGQATGRYFGKIVSAIILFIGYFMMLWDSRKQTLHDKMAGTLVVKE